VSDHHFVGRKPITEGAMIAGERRRRRELGGSKVDIAEARIAELEARVKEVAAEFAEWAARAKRERMRTWPRQLSKPRGKR